MEKSLNKIIVIRHKNDNEYTMLDGETNAHICERVSADDVIRELVNRNAICIEFREAVYINSA